MLSPRQRKQERELARLRKDGAVGGADDAVLLEEAVVYDGRAKTRQAQLLGIRVLVGGRAAAEVDGGVGGGAGAARGEANGGRGVERVAEERERDLIQRTRDREAEPAADLHRLL